MHKPYKCSIRGAEVADLPMPELKQQMSHVVRSPFAVGRAESHLYSKEKRWGAEA